MLYAAAKSTILKPEENSRHKFKGLVNPSSHCNLDSGSWSIQPVSKTKCSRISCSDHLAIPALLVLLYGASSRGDDFRNLQRNDSGATLQVQTGGRRLRGGGRYCRKLGERILPKRDLIRPLNAASLREMIYYQVESQYGYKG
jgi:hypothetical protein